MHASTALLDADEAPPFEVVNPDGASRMVIIVDHASNRIPRRLHNLGLDAASLDTHIAWDAGAALVARQLAALLDAPLVLAGYSRLVIDCNRSADSVASILEVSDNVRISGNQNLAPVERALRRGELFEPYHQAITQLLDRRGPATVLLGMHSFTPVLQARARPWQLGVCYGEDTRMAARFLAALQALPGLVIGDNEPYTIEAGIDFSLPHHAGPRVMPHMMLEFRADTLGSAAEVSSWAQRLADIWERQQAGVGMQ